MEKEQGSLTAGVEDTITPWQIWLNGGPGSSSLVGFFFEVNRFVIVPTTFVDASSQNGPIRLNADYSASPNNYSFDKLADTVWIDQPV